MDQMNLTSREYQELIDEYDELYIADICRERQLPDINDGMRIVQRRLFWSFLNLSKSARNSFSKSASIIGDTLKLHPHGDSSCYGSLVQEVNSPAGLLKGKGNWGSPNGFIKFGAAAMRYTEVKFLERANRYFDLANLSILQPGEIELPEPKFIPVPLPYALISGFFGMVKGVGVSMVPSYNPKDLLARLKYLLKKGPKVIIKPDYGLNLDVQGEFERILTEGKGEIIIPPTIVLDEKKNTITISEVSPDLANAQGKLETLSEHPKYGRYIITKDLTSKSTCIVIEYTTKYMKNVDVKFEDIVKYVTTLFTTKINYNILVYRNFKDYPTISVDEWLLYNFNMISKFRLKQINVDINNLNEKISLNDAIRVLRPLIQAYMNKYKVITQDIYQQLLDKSLIILNNNTELLNKVYSSSITKLLTSEIDNTTLIEQVKNLELEKTEDKVTAWCLNWIKEWSKS